MTPNAIMFELALLLFIVWLIKYKTTPIRWWIMTLILVMLVGVISMKVSGG